MTSIGVDDDYKNQQSYSAVKCLSTGDLTQHLSLNKNYTKNLIN
jgi:hypothetical protein